MCNHGYAENEASAVQGGAPWVTSAGDGRVGWAARQDYAEAAANVLAAQGHENKIYELGGKPLTQEEFVSILSGVLGREVPCAT